MRETHISTSEVTTLAHETRDDPMEGGSLVSETVLPSAELQEVPSRLRDNIRAQSEFDPSSVFAVDLNVEEHDRKSSSCHFRLVSFGVSWRGVRRWDGRRRPEGFCLRLFLPSYAAMTQHSAAQRHSTAQYD